jgi:hypothetical protein
MATSRDNALYAQDIPDALLKRFRKRLIDDDLSFRSWLIEQIKAYLRSKS